MILAPGFPGIAVGRPGDPTPGKGGGVPFGALLLNGQTITLNNDPITLVEEG